MSGGVCFMCREWSLEAQARFSKPGVRLCMVCWSECLDESTRKAIERGGLKAVPEGVSLRGGPDRSVSPPPSLYKMGNYEKGRIKKLELELQALRLGAGPQTEEEEEAVMAIVSELQSFRDRGYDANGRLLSSDA